MSQATTLGELKDSNYEVLPVREEMRLNLIRKLRARETIFPDIVGYQDTVVPQIVNAILSGQDIILLGERGQAKSRIIRTPTGIAPAKTHDFQWKFKDFPSLGPPAAWFPLARPAKIFRPLQFPTEIYGNPPPIHIKT